MITIREIAQAAGVSVSTASIVLRGESEKRKVAPATTEKVLQVAQALDYTPNVSARRLHAGHLRAQMRADDSPLYPRSPGGQYFPPLAVPRRDYL